MAMLLVDAPAREPLTVAETKLHLRLDTDDDDALITSLIQAARMHLERLLGRALISQTWVEIRDCWPVHRAPVLLARAPAQDIVDIRIVDRDGVAESLNEDDYFLDAVSAPPRLSRLATGDWPRPGRSINGIEIEFVAGFGDTPDDVPAPLRQALLLLVCAWYETRQPVDFNSAVSALPPAVAGLVAPWRLRMFG
ncbi:MAG: head-tail connector protein [Pseudomonadota bacterium]